MSKVFERDALADHLEVHRGTARVVFTNGCYDLLHVGHVRLLQMARARGDILVVGINSDASVKRLKGPTRPIVGAAERAEILAALECVSFVTVFDEDTPVETIRAVRPNVHVKGGDYIPETLPEMPVLNEIGASVEIFPLVDGASSTRLIERACTAGIDPRG